MIRSYRQLDMQELEILNMTLEKLDDDPTLPGEGRVWFSNNTNLPRIRAGGQNRFLVSPDDDFNFTLPLKDTLYINDTLLIYDIEHSEYRRIKASVILDQMSTIKDVFKTFHSEYGERDIIANGDDEIYFNGDGELLKSIGGIEGTKSIKYDLRDQFAMMVLAGPLDVVSGKPTFRHLTDGDLPSSYDPDKWNTAVDYTTITTGNPTNVTMLDLGYIVVTTVGDPGTDGNIPTEKSVRDAITAIPEGLVPVSDILYWDSANSKYIPYAAKTAGKFDTGSVDPSHTNRLNYDGYLYVTKIFSGGGEATLIDSAVSSLLAASIVSGTLVYDPWSSANKDDGRLYWGTTNPSNTKRLNYDGWLYTTKLIGDIYTSSVMSPPSSALTINCASSTTGLAGSLFIYSGDYAVNNGNGGDLFLRSGKGHGTGVAGNIFFSDGYVGVLPAKGSETNVIFYDDTTGKLSYGIAGVSYTNAAATPTALGGIAAGSTFSAQSMQQMWDAFLYPYQVPVFTAFWISGQASPLECGVYMDTASKQFYWSRTNYTNIQANSLAIYDMTASSSLATGLSDTSMGAIVSCGSITSLVTGGTQVYRLSGTNSNSVAMTPIYSTTVWYSPFYYGVGATGLSVASIQALTKPAISAKSNRTYSFSPTSQKFYFAYPASYLYLTSIKDPSGFDITSSFTVSTKSFTTNSPNYKGTTMNYYVYESNSLTTQTGFLITFNF